MSRGNPLKTSFNILLCLTIAFSAIAEDTHIETENSSTESFSSTEPNFSSMGIPAELLKELEGLGEAPGNESLASKQDDSELVRDNQPLNKVQEGSIFEKASGILRTGFFKSDPEPLAVSQPIVEKRFQGDPETEQWIARAIASEKSTQTSIEEIAASKPATASLYNKLVKRASFGIGLDEDFFAPKNAKQKSKK
jgi:hypothetical protein